MSTTSNWLTMSSTEVSHLWRWNERHRLWRSTGCNLPTTAEGFPGIGLTDRGQALNNADSYGRFASEPSALNVDASLVEQLHARVARSGAGVVSVGMSASARRRWATSA